MERCRIPTVAFAVVVAVASCGSATTSGGADPTEAPDVAPQEAVEESAPVREQELQAFADGLVASTGSDGGIVALAAGGGEPVVVVSGVADARTGQPIEADDPVLVASITKSYVAAALLALEADGVLGLDDPLSDWVEWPDAEVITIRSLLQMTSGVAGFGDGSDIDPTYIELRNDAAHDYTIDEVLDVTRARPPAGPPGTPRYTNLAYVLAGAVVERATGEPLRDVLAARVFAPAGLDDTWYPPAGPDDPAPLPGIYEVAPSLPLLHTADAPQNAAMTLQGPATGAVSTVPDLLGWSRAVLHDHRVGDLDVTAMTEIGPAGYGLGVIGVSSEGACVFDACPPGTTFPRLALNGDIAGSSTRVMFDPASDTTLLVYLNRNNLSLDGPMQAFLDELP